MPQTTNQSHGAITVYRPCTAGAFPRSQLTAAHHYLSRSLGYQVLTSCLATLETKPIKAQLKQGTHKYCIRVVLTYLNIKEYTEKASKNK